MIKDKESKQERFPEKRNPNKKDSKKEINIQSADRWSI
jgi:hypothetical protein